TTHRFGRRWRSDRYAQAFIRAPSWTGTTRPDAGSSAGWSCGTSARASSLPVSARTYARPRKRAHRSCSSTHGTNGPKGPISSPTKRAVCFFWKRSAMPSRKRILSSRGQTWRPMGQHRANRTAMRLPRFPIPQQCGPTDVERATTERTALGVSPATIPHALQFAARVVSDALSDHAGNTLEVEVFRSDQLEPSFLVERFQRNLAHRWRIDGFVYEGKCRKDSDVAHEIRSRCADHDQLHDQHAECRVTRARMVLGPMCPPPIFDDVDTAWTQQRKRDLERSSRVSV